MAMLRLAAVAASVPEEEVELGEVADSTPRRLPAPQPKPAANTAEVASPQTLARPTILNSVTSTSLNGVENCYVMFLFYLTFIPTENYI